MLCWECKPGVPCSECTGCNVCRGPLDPCPKDLETPWSLPAAEMRALFNCAQRGDPEGMQAAISSLHERGGSFDPNASLGGATLLTLVAQSGSVRCLELLQKPEGDASLDPNKRNPNGDAALMLAIVQDHQPMVEALLKCEGIDANPQLVRISIALSRFLSSLFFAHTHFAFLIFFATNSPPNFLPSIFAVHSPPPIFLSDLFCCLQFCFPHFLFSLIPPFSDVDIANG